MYKRLFLLLLVILSVAPFLAAADKMPIAIMDMEGIDVQKTTARAVSDLMRTELFNTGLFRVFERSEMEKILKEQQFGMTGLTDIEYAVKVGKLLSAKKILVGSVSKLGASFIINARIIDVEKGEMEFGDKAKAESQSDLDLAAETFAKKLAARIIAKQKSEKVKEIKVPEREKQPEPEPEPDTPGKSSGLRLRIPSYICMGAGLVSGVIAFIYNGKAKTEYDNYSKLAYPEVSGWYAEDWDTEWDKVEKPLKTRNLFRGIGIILGGTGVAMFAVDYFFLRRPSSSSAYLEKKHNLNLALNNGYGLEYTYRW